MKQACGKDDTGNWQGRFSAGPNSRGYMERLSHSFGRLVHADCSRAGPAGGGEVGGDFSSRGQNHGFDDLVPVAVHQFECGFGCL